MAFDDALAARIRDCLAHKKNIEEKKMFGGIGFLLNGNILVGVWKNSLIVRLEPEAGKEAMLEPHVKAFDITGKPMKGWILVWPSPSTTIRSPAERPTSSTSRPRNWIRPRSSIERTLKGSPPTLPLRKWRCTGHRFSRRGQFPQRFPAAA